MRLWSTTPSSPNFCHRCFHSPAGQSFLRPHSAGCSPSSPGGRKCCLHVPASPPPSRLRLASLAVCWQGTLLTVTHRGEPRLCAPLRTGTSRRCRHSSCSRRYPLGRGSFPAALGMDIEEMTSPPQQAGKGRGGGGGTTAKFGRENSEERCLRRPDGRFFSLYPPPLGAPKSPSPSGAGCPKPCQLRGRRRTQPAAGRGAGQEVLEVSPASGSAPIPSPSPAMPGCSRRRKLGGRLGIKGRE